MLASDPFPSSAPPPAPPPRSSLPPGLSPGLVVAGKYELLRRLGAGAMGEVWAALHLSLGEEVAVKLVVRNVDHQDGSSSDSRFLVEARVAATLSRKTRHIVGVTDHGEDGNLAYLVMEILEGESLDARLERGGPLALAQAVPVIGQIARGLAVAHADGVVHRDLKPSNVFVTVDEDGKALVKILDFGIAKLRSRTDRSALHRTQRGFLLGTPAYMSPEQARGLAVDHRADVWALAVIAYHLLTDRFPFEGETPEDMFARLCRNEPTPIREFRPELPKVVEDFFRRAFAERLDDRFQSAVALAGAFEQLEPLAAGRQVTLPPPKPEREGENESESGNASGPSLESSIFVAGVPRRRRLLPLLAIGALVACVLGGTGAAVSIYYEHEPAKATGLTATPAAPAVKPPPVAEARGEQAPKPVLTPVDLPAAGSPSPPPPQAAPPAHNAAPPRGDRASASQAIAPPGSPAPPPAAAAPSAPPPAAAAPRAPRKVDPSEVF